MKRWDSGAGHVGPERRTGLGRDSRDHGGWATKRCLPTLARCTKQESGKQLTEVYSGTIGQSLAQYKAGRRGFRIPVSDRQTLEDWTCLLPLRFQPSGSAVLAPAWKKGLKRGIAAGPPKSKNPVRSAIPTRRAPFTERPLSDS